MNHREAWSVLLGEGLSLSLGLEAACNSLETPRKDA